MKNIKNLKNNVFETSANKIRKVQIEALKIENKKIENIFQLRNDYFAPDFEYF